MINSVMTPQAKNAVRLYKAGWAFLTAAKKAGVSPSTFRGYLCEAGLRIRDPLAAAKASTAYQERKRSLCPKHVTARPSSNPDYWFKQQHDAFIAALEKHHPERRVDVKT